MAFIAKKVPTAKKVARPTNQAAHEDPDPLGFAQVRAEISAELAEKYPHLLQADAEVESELERVARETEVPLSKVKAHYASKAEREGLREKIGKDKTLAFLQAGANIEEG